MQRSKSRLFAITAATLMAAAGLAHAQTATWVGGSSANWSDPANWFPPVVPLSNTFDVIIPAGVQVVIDPGVPMSFSLNSLNLNASATLTVGPSRSVALTEGSIAGRVVAQDNAVFDATGPGVVFAGSPTFASSGGGVIRARAQSYTVNLAGADRTVFSSTGAGSLLDLSSIQSYTRNSDGDRFFDSVDRITASNLGSIDLSGLQTITSNAYYGGADGVIFRADSGGSIDLGALQTTGGSGYVSFEVYNGGTLDLSSLTTVASGAGNRFSVGAGSTLDLDALTSAWNSTFSLGLGSTVNAMALTSARNSTFSLGLGSTINATALESLTSSAVTIDGQGTLNLGTLTDIDTSTIAVSNGQSFGTGTINAQSYTVNLAGADRTAFSSTGAGSLLDLSSIQSYTRNSDGDRFFDSVDRITASNLGSIDLSGLQTITSNAYYGGADGVIFRADSGGSIDLGALQTTGGSGYVSFEVATNGALNFNDITVGNNARLTSLDNTASIAVAEQLTLGGTGVLDMAEGASLNIGGNLLLTGTNEANFKASSSLIRFTGSGTFGDPQWLEVGGIDAGVMDPGNNGNFGFGQLIIGTDTQSTIVQLVDLFDNGNRMGGDIGDEALYLYGLGGPDGLIINSGSTLFIDNINVYAAVNGEFLWLNSLFTDGVTSVAYGGGSIVIPSPASAALLATMGLCLASCRWRSVWQDD